MNVCSHGVKIILHVAVFMFEQPFSLTAQKDTGPHMWLVKFPSL